MIEILHSRGLKARRLAWYPRINIGDRSYTALFRDAGRIVPPSKVGQQLTPRGEKSVVLRFRPTEEVLLDRPRPIGLALLTLRWETLVDSLFPIALVLRTAGTVPLGQALAVTSTAVCFHAASNVLSEVSQHLQGVDSLHRSGGSKVLQRGWVTARDLTYVGAILALVAVVLVVGFVLRSPSPSLLGVTAVGLLAASQYSYPPLNLNRTPFGDLLLLVLFGPWLAGGVAIAVGSPVSAEIVLAGMLAAAAVGLRRQVRAMRRLPDDAMIGRRTLAVQLGLAGSKVAVVGFCGFLVAAPVVSWALGASSERALAALLGALPLGWILHYCMTAPFPHHPQLGRASRLLTWAVPTYATAMILAWS